MGKVNLLVKYCLRNTKDEYNINGILIDNTLKFLDKDSKMILDFKTNTLKRITQFLEIVFAFNEKICFIIVKENKRKLHFNFDLLELENKKNYFYVKYKIESDNFEIEIFIN